MTDLVKRATPRADALTTAEYRTGVERLDRLCAWLQPAAVCVVGLAGWRVAIDRKAEPGWQDAIARWPPRLRHAEHQRPERRHQPRRPHRPPPDGNRALRAPE